MTEDKWRRGRVNKERRRKNVEKGEKKKGKAEKGRRRDGEKTIKDESKEEYKNGKCKKIMRKIYA